MYFIFLLSPIFALLYSVFHINRPSAKNIILLYCGIFGYCIEVGQSYLGDAARYVDAFERLSEEKYSFLDRLSRLYSNTANFDILTDALNNLVGSFSADYHILLMVYGLIYGFFFSRNFEYIARAAFLRKRGQHIFSAILIVLFFVLPLWNINGFRFWTAMQIALYSILPYILEKNKTKLGFLVFAILLHSAYFLVIPLLLIFHLFNRRIAILVALTLISLVLRIGISQETLTSLISQILPDIFLDKYSTYLAPVEQQTGGGTFVKPIRQIYGLFIQFALILMWWLGRKDFAKNELILRVISFALLCSCVLNVLSIIPSVGRFLILVSYFYFIFCLAISVSPRGRIRSDLKIIVAISILVFSVDFAAALMAEGIKIISVASIIAPPILAPLFISGNMSLFDFFN